MKTTTLLLPALLAGLSLPAYAVSPVENNLYDAQGHLTQRTDGAGHTTGFGYDPLGRLLQLTQPDGGTVALSYDGQDQVTQVTDPVGQTTQYTRDAWGDVLQTASPDSGTTARTYDAAGNLLTTTDALGQVTTYIYEALDRPVSRSSSVGGTPAYQYLYDTVSMSFGHVTFSTDSAHQNIWKDNYDAQGRFASRAEAILGTSHIFTIFYTYHPGGQLASVTYPDGRVVSYQYDAQGRVSEVDAQPSAGGAVTVLAHAFSYAPFGGAVSYTFGNGLSYVQALDPDGRPTVQQSGPWSKSASYDAAGNVAGLMDASGTQQSFGYDAVDRLIQAVDTDTSSYGSLGYTYDLNGNRVSATQNAATTAYTYSPANRLVKVGADNRLLDGNGNTVYVNGLTLVYDGYQRLVAVNGAAAGSVSYGYDSLDQRTSKTVNGQTTYFVYGPERTLLAEREPDGSMQDYVWLDGHLLARLDSASGATSPTVYAYHTDALGTPQAMTDASGATVWRARYTPFGQATVTVSTIANNVRLPGQYFDQETGFHYNLHRYYDPTTGRYLQADPIGLDAGSNVYAYVEGNPLSYVDPKGLAGVLPGPIPLPVPLPSTPSSNKPQGDGSYGGLFPPDDFPAPIDPWGPNVNTEQRVPSLPPIKPPEGGGDQFCQKVLDRCMKGANVCFTPVRQVATSGCFALYLMCRAAGKGGDHHSDQ